MRDQRYNRTRQKSQFLVAKNCEALKLMKNIRDDFKIQQ